MRKGTDVINRHRTFATLLAVTAVTMLCATPALAHRGRVFGTSFGSPGSGAGQLSLVPIGFRVQSARGLEGGSGLAVDESTGDVYVADTGNNRVDEFSPTGAFVQAWGWGVKTGAAELQVCTESSGCRAGLSGTNPGEFAAPTLVAVDNTFGGEGDVYVADQNYVLTDNTEIIPSQSVVQKFSASGKLIESWGTKGQVTASSVPPPNVFGAAAGIVVQPSGGVLLGTGEGIFELDRSSGAFVRRLGTVYTNASYSGIGVDGAGNIYRQGTTPLSGHAQGDNAITSILRLNMGENLAEEAVFPLVEESIEEVAYIRDRGIAVALSGELFVDEGNAVQVISASCQAVCKPASTFTSPDLSEGTALAVDSHRESLYISEVAADKIESIVPEPPAAPLVEAGTESASEVSGDSATLEAAISPRSEPNEEPTSYRFQYTSEESFQREGFAGAGSMPVPNGELAPNFESDVVTTHVQGLKPGTVYRYRVVAENAVSRRESKPSEGERNGTGEEIAHTFTTQTSGVFSLPDARAWELVSPTNKHGALLEPLLPQAVVQASASGDAFTYLMSAPPGESSPEGYSGLAQIVSTRVGAGASSWSSHDIGTPHEVTSGFDGEGDPLEYRFFSSDLSVSILNPFGAFDPSLSSEASEQTALLRSDFTGGNPADVCSSACYRPLVTGASGFANVPEGTEFGEGRCEDSRGCGPRFEGATADASHVILRSDVPLVEGAPARSLYEWTEGKLQLVSVLPNGEPAPGGGTLGYAGNEGNARNAISTDGSRVVWAAGNSLYLSDTVSEETVQLGGASANFQDASSDDTRVFFTVAGDLYVFEAPDAEPLSAGHLTNLTPAGKALGVIAGVSRDGSYAYLVDESALSGDEANEHGETAVAGRPNLYVEHEGAFKLVAVLSNADEPDWIVDELGNPAPSLSSLTASVSPDGNWLAFMSERPLTGYDNRDAVSGEPDEEVFLYDATAGAGQDGLVCASCNPTGARPHGLFVYKPIAEATLVDEQEAWSGGRWLAANVPGWTTPSYQSRYLSDSGRLFFNSDDALVPSDTNGKEDVYEYEPPGVGDCTNAGTTFSPRYGGCVDLISSGTSKEESAFLDASETGDDVFFMTSAQLSKQDTDATPDVYDARVDGGFPEPQAAPACEGDACQSPVAAPDDPTPGSLTYSGPGNPVPLLTPTKVVTKKTLKCAKGKKPVHGKCVKVKKKKAKKAAKKTGRASEKRGDRS